MNPPKFKHKRVEAELRQLVRTLPIDARLPSERSLATTYNCNFLTVRRAMKQLVDDGSVIRRIGSGTFVASHVDGESVSEGVSGRIGVLVYQSNNPYAYRVIQAVAHAGLEQGVDLRSTWIRDFGPDALEQIKQFKKDGCVAVTLPWFPHEQTEQLRSLVVKSPLPVGLPILIPGLEENCFEKQEVFGKSLLVIFESLCSYFYELGHRRIAMLGPDSANDLVLQKSLSAYACYTSRENLESICGLVRPGAKAMDHLAERWKSYRGELAVVSYDDEHALRFMTAMHKLGLSAPKDFQIIGHNDTEASAYSDPPLSTVVQNFDYIGHWLVKSALGLSSGESCQSDSLPSPTLLVRSTCGGSTLINDTLRHKLKSITLRVAESNVGQLQPA